MKNKFRSLCLLLVSLMLLAACSPAKNTNLSAIYQKMEETGVLPFMLPLDANEAFQFMGLEEGWFTQQQVYISQDSLLADEVILLLAKDEQSAGAAQDMLTERLSAKAQEARSYSPEQYAIIQQGLIKRDGLLLALLVSPKVQDLEQVYNRMK